MKTKPWLKNITEHARTNTEFLHLDVYISHHHQHLHEEININLNKYRELLKRPSLCIPCVISEQARNEANLSGDTAWKYSYLDSSMCKRL